MQIIPRSKIRISSDRQRGEISPDDIAEKVESIRKVGLLHPVVCSSLPDTADVDLRAGETRLRAIDFIHMEGDSFRCGTVICGPGDVPITLLEELSPIAAFEVELEENVRRKDLPWTKQTAAYARLHALKLQQGLSGREAIRETEAHIAKVAGSAVRSLGEAHQDIVLGGFMDDPDIAKAGTKKEALKILSRKLMKEEDLAAPATVQDTASYLNRDCLDVLPTLESASFDCILSDPPYGIGIKQLSYQNTSEQEYDDSYESWRNLMPRLFEELSRVLKPNASGYLFCDFSRFDDLTLYANLAGFETYPKPLIWDRSPDGRLTTAEKWPRRCYECILYFRRGTRGLFEVRGDVLRHPADRTSENYHGAKKPVELMVDLLERVCRPGDNVLDCFAGSGPVARAATRLNMRFLAVEKDPSYYGLMLRLAGDKK